MTYHRVKQRGGALISALIAVIVLATMALGLSSLMMTSNGTVIDTEDRLHALLLAQSGLAVAYSKINVATFATLPDGTVMHSENINDFRRVNVIKSTNAAGRSTLLSTGTVDKKVILGNVITVSRTLEGVVGIQNFSGSFFSGAFGLGNLDIGGNFMTDSYDANAGPYGPGNMGNMGNVGTNGVLTYHGSFFINGNASPGPGQPPVVSDQISGSGAPLTAPVSITAPPYVVPPGASTTFTPTLVGSNGESAPPRNFHFSTLSNAPKDTLLIEGKVNIYVDGDIDLKGNIVLADQNSEVNIYQKSGALTVNGGGKLNAGYTVTIPSQTVIEPEQTIEHPATSYTINRDPSDQSAPTLGPRESIADTIYTTTKVKGKTTTYISQYVIAVEAYTEVIPEREVTIPAQTITYNGGIPSKFNIISLTTDAVKLNGGADFYGTIVAPNAEVTVNGNAEKYGAVIGKTTRLLGTGDFHRDMSARSPGIVSKPILLAHREVY